jgi:hypothetical protein
MPLGVMSVKWGDHVALQFKDVVQFTAGKLNTDAVRKAVLELDAKGYVSYICYPDTLFLREITVLR